MHECVIIMLLFMLLNQRCAESKLLSPSCSVTELGDVTVVLGFIPGSGKGARLSMHVLALAGQTHVLMKNTCTNQGVLPVVRKTVC